MRTQRQLRLENSGAATDGDSGSGSSSPEPPGGAAAPASGRATRSRRAAAQKQAGAAGGTDDDSSRGMTPEEPEAGARSPARLPAAPAAARAPRAAAVPRAPPAADGPAILYAGPAGWPGQHPLRIDSAPLVYGLLAVPLVIWWFCVLSGIAAFRGLPDGRKVRHPMMWFDRGVLRPAGSLLPFAILTARVAVGFAADLFAPAPAPAAAAGGGRQRRRRLGTLAWSCAWLYALIALARLLLYLSHYYAMRGSLFAEHLVSDHLFLGGTILICLQSEAMALVSDALRTLEARVTPREIGLTGTFLAALFLYMCTAIDMYYTARFYHYPLESLATTVAVFFLFQAPVVRWLLHSWRRATPGAPAARGGGVAPAVVF